MGLILQLIAPIGERGRQPIRGDSGRGDKGVWACPAIAL